jgi:hypothetical protein
MKFKSQISKEIRGFKNDEKSINYLLTSFSI